MIQEAVCHHPGMCSSLTLGITPAFLPRCRPLNLEKQFGSHPGQIWETSPSRVTAWGLVQGL